MVKPPAFTDIELQNIRDNCSYWANNCGGCETCLRTFGDPPPYDHLETLMLVGMVQDLKAKLAIAVEALCKIDENFHCNSFMTAREALTKLRGSNGYQ